MQKDPSAQRSAYLTALTQEIERKLQKALSSQSQRFDLLQLLFADIALEIDDRARDIILIRDEDEVTAADDGIENSLCFYDVLANHFVKVPENGKRILHLIVHLWSQSFASHIFALLFINGYLFEVPPENSEAVLRYGSALVQGATNVFWYQRRISGGPSTVLGASDPVQLTATHFSPSSSIILQLIDIQTNTRRFLSMFSYLLEEVALVPDHLNKISLQTRRDLFSLLSRFIFFYNLDHLLENILKQFPSPTNAFLVGGPADLFVIELTDQLQKLKVEPVLLHYLSHMRAIQGWELRITTSTRLKACLYSFTSPGGPMYPTRAVRHAAWDTLDLLFPVGRHPRHVISIFFRLLYPWYWPSSCWNFITTFITTVFYSILRLIFSSWENVTKAKLNS